MTGDKVTVLVVGSGGREHVTAWKFLQSPRVAKLYVAPGNAGITAMAWQDPRVEQVAARENDEVLALARERAVDITFVGPESPLSSGIVDQFRAEGLAIFGPTRAAARLEYSKAYAKDLMAKLKVPIPEHRIFDDPDAARAYIERQDDPVVVKADGLAAGKGSLVCDDVTDAFDAVDTLMVERKFGAAGDRIVIEQRLYGTEASFFCFTDGNVIKPLAWARDYKRVFNGDRGPNTGGMGGYSPNAEIDPGMVDKIMNRIARPLIDGLAREEGVVYKGILYIGLMLVEEGGELNPSVLEINIRMGDPEAQVIYPRLQTDFADICDAVIRGELDQLDFVWSNDAYVCVCATSGRYRGSKGWYQGYPDRYGIGKPISGLDKIDDDVLVFHAGTRWDPKAGKFRVHGGRVLSVVAGQPTLAAARDRVYQELQKVSFTGIHYRTDIAMDGRVPALEPPARSRIIATTYADAGVDIEAGNRAVAMMRDAVRSTYSPRVLVGVGAFGGLFDASDLPANAVLVASTDGVGTKVKLASAAGRFDTIGQDIVNHCVNDILVQGARPLFFLDYIASSRLDPQMMAQIVEGIAMACRMAGCALLGGETAEMPGVYHEGEFDLVGTVVGVVSRDDILPRHIEPGDVLLGLASSGPHTNGYSLIRRVLAGLSLDTEFEGVVSLGDALLAPHRCYRPAIHRLRAAGVPVRGLIHITGGGFVDNIPRVLPEGTAAIVHRDAWPVPPIFRLIQERGNIDTDEMYRVFNMGIGMIVVVPVEAARPAQMALGEESWVIGEVVRGQRGVAIV